jgi:hypothetical protein
LKLDADIVSALRKHLFQLRVKALVKNFAGFPSDPCDRVTVASPLGKPDQLTTSLFDGNMAVNPPTDGGSNPEEVRAAITLRVL